MSRVFIFLFVLTFQLSASAAEYEARFSDVLFRRHDGSRSRLTLARVGGTNTNRAWMTVRQGTDLVKKVATITYGPYAVFPALGSPSFVIVRDVDDTGHWYYVEFQDTDERGAPLPPKTVKAEIYVAYKATIGRDALEEERHGPLTFLANDLTNNYRTRAIAKWLKDRLSAGTPTTNLQLFAQVRAAFALDASVPLSGAKIYRRVVDTEPRFFIQCWAYLDRAYTQLGISDDGTYFIGNPDYVGFTKDATGVERVVIPNGSKAYVWDPMAVPQLQSFAASFRHQNGILTSSWNDTLRNFKVRIDFERREHELNISGDGVRETKELFEVRSH